MYARDNTGAVGYVTPTHTIPSMESFGGYGQHSLRKPSRSAVQYAARKAFFVIAITARARRLS